jgi:hypothetical protein
VSQPNTANLDIPEAKPLPDQIEITVGLHLRDPRPAAPAQLVNLRELLGEMNRRIARVLLEPHNTDEELLWIIKVSFQLWSQRIGALPSLQALRRPDNAERLAIPGVDCLLKGAPLLRRDVPTALDGLDLEQISDYRRRLLVVREVVQATEIFLDSVNALSSHLEHGVVNPCWTVAERTESVRRTNGEIRRILGALYELCGGYTAKEAAETKKKTERAKEQTAEKVKAAYEAKDKDKDKEGAKAKDDNKDEDKDKDDPKKRRR